MSAARGTRDISTSPLPRAGEVGARSATGGGAVDLTKSPHPNPAPQAGEGDTAARSIEWRTTPKARENARRLRRDMTDAERAIWRELRAHRLNGASFRRQKPIGPYIVDFVCHAARLIIEIDGGQHYETKGLENDTRRDAYLISKGFHVLRLSNHDVLTNKSGALETITTAIQGKAPSPPSPASGGGDNIEGEDAS